MPIDMFGNDIGGRRQAPTAAMQQAISAFQAANPGQPYTASSLASYYPQGTTPVDPGISQKLSEALTWYKNNQPNPNKQQEAQNSFDQVMGLYNSGVLNAGHLDMAVQAIKGDTINRQALNEIGLRSSQLADQNKQLADFRNQRATQYFGSPNASLSEALAGGKGDLADLNSFLGKQQSATFNQELKPLINMQMGGQGLQDSGANIELQAKALGQLERERQQSMMQAALGARQQIAGLGREDILGDIGARQQSLTDAFGLQRAGITMQFQQQLEDQRAQLARELSSRNGAQQGGLGNILTGGLMGAGMGFMAGGPWGAAAGAGIGAYGGSQSYNNAGAMQSGMMGGQAGGFFRNDASTRQPQWTNPASSYRGPMNANSYSWLGNGGY